MSWGKKKSNKNTYYYQQGKKNDIRETTSLMTSFMSVHNKSFLYQSPDKTRFRHTPCYLKAWGDDSPWDSKFELTDLTSQTLLLCAIYKLLPLWWICWKYYQKICGLYCKWHKKYISDPLISVSSHTCLI